MSQLLSRNGAIALYDSGRGVESVLKACQSLMPREKWLIMQDAQHQSYGNKTNEEIIQAGHHCFRSMTKGNVKAIVVACHTSSAIALPWLSQRYTLPMIGMLRPTARLLADLYRDETIIWLATPASVLADRVEPLARQLGFRGRFHAVACHEWVDCIEQNRVEKLHQLVASFVDQHQSVLQSTSCKILYGCTHYPLLDGIIRKFITNSCVRIDPAIAVAEALQLMLTQRNILRKSPQSSVRCFNGLDFRPSAVLA